MRTTDDFLEDKPIRLTKRDYAIIARALQIAGIAEIGDAVGGNDAKTAKRVDRLQRHFEGKAGHNAP